MAFWLSTLIVSYSLLVVNPHSGFNSLLVVNPRFVMAHIEREDFADDTKSEFNI